MQTNQVDINCNVVGDHCYDVDNGRFGTGFNLLDVGVGGSFSPKHSASPKKIFPPLQFTVMSLRKLFSASKH